MLYDELVEAVINAIDAPAGTTDTHTGTAESGTTRTLVDTALVDDTTDWTYAIVRITGGSNSGRTAVVTAFDADTGTLTVEDAFANAMADEDTYTMSFDALGKAHVYHGQQETYDDDTTAGYRVVVGWEEETSETPPGMGSFSEETINIDILLTIPWDRDTDRASRKALREFNQQVKAIVRASYEFQGLAKDGRLLPAPGPQLLKRSDEEGDLLLAMLVRAQWMGFHFPLGDVA